MSYDLTFLAKRPDQSWDEARAEREGAAEDGARPDREMWERVLPAVRAILGPVVVFAGPEHFEAGQETTGIQVVLYSGEASITVPYWHTGAEARRIADLIYRVAAAVEEATGLPGYDPQTERPVAEAARHPEEAVACFDQVAEAMSEHRAPKRSLWQRLTRS
jgi:hypothetical protein